MNSHVFSKIIEMKIEIRLVGWGASASKGHSGTVRATADQFEYEFFEIRTSFCFTNILALGN